MIWGNLGRSMNGVLAFARMALVESRMAYDVICDAWISRADDEFWVRLQTLLEVLAVDTGHFQCYGCVVSCTTPAVIAIHHSNQKGPNGSQKFQEKIESTFLTSSFSLSLNLA